MNELSGLGSEADPAPEDQPLAAGSGSSRRFLHLTLIILVVVPAVIWLIGSDHQGDGVPQSGAADGDPAPDFTVDLFDGSTFTLSRHLAEDGRPVVLNFWASWCLPCREEMPAFDAVARKRPDILFLGVAVQDTENAARAFADEIGVAYPLGHDSTGTIVEAYPILGLPATWFITPEGIIAEQWFGQLDETTLKTLIDRLHTG